MTEGAFRYRLFADRLRLSACWGACALVLACAVPSEWLDGRTTFLWRALADLNLAHALVACWPVLCAIALLIGCVVARRPHALALLSATVVGSLVLLTFSGMTASREIAHGAWVARWAPAVAVVALAASAVRVSNERPLRSHAKILVGAATLLGALYYGWLTLTPVGPLRRVVALVAAWPSRANVVTLAVLAPFVLWPLLVLAHAWWKLLRPGASRCGLGCLAAVYGIPAMLLPFVSLALSGHPGGFAALLPAASETLILGVVLVLMAHSTAVRVLWQAVDREPAPVIPWRAKRSAIAAWAGAGIVLSLTPCVLAHQTRRAVSWQLAASSPEGDKLFGVLLPRWNDGRAREDLYGGAGAPAARTQMVQAAGVIDPRLMRAIDALGRTNGSELTPKTWERMVERVNEASRQARLPYYVDPTEMVGRAGDGDRRWFRLDTYRIEQVRSFDAQGQSVTTLHVRWLTPKRTRLRSLGLSRDGQPFALVLLDEIDTLAAELAAWASREPAQCGPAQPDDLPMQRAVQQCGARLRQIASTPQLRADLAGMIERHEVQHQLDGPELRVSAAVMQKLRVYEPSLQTVVNRELSAYLAQMTASGMAPQLTLVRLLRFATHHGWDQPEALVARLAFEAMLDRDLSSGTDAIAAGFVELMAMDDDALRRRAEAVWREQYGESLRRVVPQGR